MCDSAVNSTDSEYGAVASFCECHFGSHKSGTFLDQEKCCNIQSVVLQLEGTFKVLFIMSLKTSFPIQETW